MYALNEKLTYFYFHAHSIKYEKKMGSHWGGVGNSISFGGRALRENAVRA
jgi:hypothetical protein